jgi:uncharacterized RDD family membrane protein YckC
VLFSSRYLCTPCFHLERVRLHYGEASRGQRCVNFVLDLVFARLFQVGVWIVLGRLGWSWRAIPFVSLPMTIGYYLVLEGIWGTSIGKIVTRTKVIDASGGRPSFAQILGRTLSRFVPFDALSFLWAEHGWHDAWSGTRVVRTIAPDWMIERK